MAGRFEIQRCDGCGAHVFMPRVLCPHCGSVDLVWVTPSGRGTVYSTTTVRRRPEQGGDYNVSIIALEEGPHLMSRVDEIEPAKVQIDLPVRVRVVMGERGGVVVFVPDTEARS